MTKEFSGQLVTISLEEYNFILDQIKKTRVIKYLELGQKVEMNGSLHIVGAVNFTDPNKSFYSLSNNPDGLIIQATIYHFTVRKDWQ